MIDPLLLAVTRVSTLSDQQHLTNASGFFYSCGEQLFLVTGRHVFRDDTSEHFPDRILIKLHTNPNNLAQATDFSIPLYRNGKSIWRQAKDGTGSVDVAAVEIDRKALPEGMTYRSFDLNHVIGMHEIDIGTALLVVGFPLGFHDTLHHLPVARHAIVASCFDLRFQGQGYFLTDARTHRGLSGAPVVVRANSNRGLRSDFKWMLAGIHSSRLDVGTRDFQLDETLGLNCAWFADILPTLTATIGRLHSV